MSLRRKEGRKGLAYTLMVATALALALPLIGPATPALAHHHNFLNVSPDNTRSTSNSAPICNGAESARPCPVGTTHTLVATVDPGPATGPTLPGGEDIEVDFEIESGPHDEDGNTPESPDFTCIVPESPPSDPTESTNTCTVSYDGSFTGTDVIRAWIDHGSSDASVEADPAELEEDDDFPGTGEGCQVPFGEPDCTDVVSTTWGPGGAARLDCDDHSGPDTERETNPGGAGEHSNEYYICSVQDAFGNPVSGSITVRGEVKNGVNDPDIDETPPDSYNRPDYVCATSGGFCQMTVTQSEDDNGTAEICFWVGNATQGASFCGSEQVDETENNDLADAVESTWTPGVDSPSSVDAEPETDVNEVGLSHTITGTVFDQTGGAFSGSTTVRFEFFNGSPSDTDGNTPFTPDMTCNTSGGTSCTIQYTQSTTAGIDRICTFTTRTPAMTGDQTNGTCDIDGAGATAPEDINDPDDQPGSFDAPEPRNDSVDVVRKFWRGKPATVVVDPASDTGSVGTCNEFTATVTDAANVAVPGVILDIEQTHTATAPNQPQVGFCTPDDGTRPNPSSVNESRGDLRAPDETPDQPGTAGGETVELTDQNGKVTFGIRVAPANNSDGSGNVSVNVFYEENDNDDPEGTGEPSATATKTWVKGEGRNIDCEPEQDTNQTGTNHVVVCKVTDRFGEALQGEGVTFTEDGQGQFTSNQQQTTDAAGEARATVTSAQPGTQSVTGTLTDDVQGNEPSEVDDCDRGAGDPAGAPAGSCADSVGNTWTRGNANNLNLSPARATNRPGTQHRLTATVTDDNGSPVSGATVTWSASGVGRFVTTETTTDANGQAQATITSSEKGTTRVSATAGGCQQGGDCTDSAIKNWGPRRCDIFGTSGRDVLRGTSRAETICGFGGNDTIVGRGRGDIIEGGAGHDLLKGGNGGDTIKGGGGNDDLLGNRGKDSLRGGRGRDDLNAGIGNDNLKGGGGNDDMNGGRGTDRCAGGRGRDSAVNCER